jgi:hypothetical protein
MGKASLKATGMGSQNSDHDKNRTLNSKDNKEQLRCLVNNLYNMGLQTYSYAVIVHYEYPSLCRNVIRFFYY